MNGNVGASVKLFLLTVTHTATGFVASPVVSTMPFPLDDALRACQSSWKFDADNVVTHGPGSWNFPSVGTVGQLHLFQARLGDLLVLVIDGTDGKFVPSSMLCGDEDVDVNGAPSRVGFSNGSRSKSTTSLMSKRPLDWVTAEATGAIMFIPLVAEASAVAFVILIISWSLESKAPC